MSSFPLMSQNVNARFINKKQHYHVCLKMRNIQAIMSEHCSFVIAKITVFCLWYMCHACQGFDMLMKLLAWKFTLMFSNL